MCASTLTPTRRGSASAATTARSTSTLRTTVRASTRRSFGPTASASACASCGNAWKPSAAGSRSSRAPVAAQRCRSTFPQRRRTTMAPVRILLVDDQLLFRKGLRALLQDQEDMEVVGEASDGAQALERVRTFKPDVVLMDIHIPIYNTIEATRLIKSECPETKVIALAGSGGA